MNKTDNSYRSIASSNFLFGSVQIFNIIIGIIRSKLVAILLGPTGMGIMGLFNSTIDLIKSVSNMGLQTSAVRDVSLASDTNNISKIALVSKVLSRMVWCTGILGTLLMLIFAPQLSNFSFNSQQYVPQIRILSVVILLSQLTIGKTVLLQGMRQLKSLAFSSVIGSLLGLLLTIPLYYFYGEAGIVPSIIINAFIVYFISLYFTRQIHIPSSSITWKKSFINGKEMIKMGALINLTGLMDVSVAYITKNFIQLWGTVIEVGLYTAGFAIVQAYMGLIFNSIGTDYYPRLIVASADKERCIEMVNKQFELMILILTPLVILFIICSKLLLYILYSSEFLSIHLMIGWTAFGMIFRAYSWCPGFMYLAKNDSKLYFIIYIFTIITNLIGYLGLYYWIGLVGIGIAFTVMYILGSVTTIIIVKKRYGVVYYSTSNIFLTIATLASGITLGLCYIEHWGKYVIQIVIFLTTSAYCLYQLNKRLDIKSYIIEHIKKQEISK